MSGARQGRLDRYEALFARVKRSQRLLLGTAALSSIALCAAASDTHEIVQEGRAFHPGEVTISAGDTLSFSNHDEFIHQIYVKSAGLDFDSDEQSPGHTVSVRFPALGRFNVRCHIHPKMTLIVNVQ